MASTTTYLSQLLDRMVASNDHQPVGSATTSWQAHREAEGLTDPALFPMLQEMIKTETDAGRRYAVYTILGYLAKNTRNTDMVEFMIETLQNEKDEQTIHHILLSIYSSQTPFNKHVDILASYADDDRDLIRNAAIRCLSLDKSGSPVAEDTLIDVLKSPYDDYGCQYAADSLCIVGSRKAIPFLQDTLEWIESEDAINAIRRAIKALKT